jgi:hypothetical protein
LRAPEASHVGLLMGNLAAATAQSTVQWLHLRKFT